MGITGKLSGVFAAAITPLNEDLSPNLEGLHDLISFLSTRGCHGALIMGTTGEGPSFSIDERLSIYQATADARQSIPGFILLAGTGTPSLEDTIHLTRSSFDNGFDGVVVLPPYYFRKATEDGLFAWFSKLIHKAVPSDGALLAYHIPPVTGVSLSLDFISRLQDAFPAQFIGIKDSSADPEWMQSLGARFGSDLAILNGNDRLFSLALQSKASGCITALANVLSPLHRTVWDNFQAGSDNLIAQDKLTAAREICDRYPPMPPLIKMLLSRLYGIASLKVKPPLMDFEQGKAEIVLSEFLSATGQII